MNIKRKLGFTIVEISIAATIMVFILYFAYQVFFAQAKLMSQTVDALQTNEGFRRVMSFMGDDVREATRIVKPSPINLEDVPKVQTTIGSILILQSSEVDPKIPFDSPLGGQISQRTEIEYELEPMIPKSDIKPLTTSDEPILYRLVRNATIEEKSGEKNKQRHVICENVRELYVYRTVRKPFKATNIENSTDRLIESIPLSHTGTGNNVLHLKMVLERSRKPGERDRKNVYTITMNTSFFKRGKEIFLHP